MDEHDVRAAFRHAAAEAPSWPPVEQVLRAAHRARRRRRNLKIVTAAAAVITAVVSTVTFAVVLSRAPVEPATRLHPTTTTSSTPTQLPASPVMAPS